MPINLEYELKNLSKAEFDERDQLVMGCAFDSQNALGRLLDEENYEQDLVRRLRAEGFREVRNQVSIEVIHGKFRKVYRLDLLADDALYELKTVRGFLPEHDAQVLNYTMLLEVNHGKLINFRCERVEGRLRFNPVRKQKRYQIRVDESRWQTQGPGCDELKCFVKELLQDWGLFLDFRLYERALIDHFGGESRTIKRLPIKSGGAELGKREFTFHSQETAFLVSGFPQLRRQRPHVRRLFESSPFNALQWINFHHADVQFETMTRGPVQANT